MNGGVDPLMALMNPFGIARKNVRGFVPGY
jgi:hypothetical protein